MKFWRFKRSICVSHEMASHIILIDLIWWREKFPNWSLDADKFSSFTYTAIDRTILNVMLSVWYLALLTLKSLRLDMERSLHSRWKIAQQIWDDPTSGVHPSTVSMAIFLKFWLNRPRMRLWHNGRWILTQSLLTIISQGVIRWDNRSTSYLIHGVEKMTFIWMVIRKLIWKYFLRKI